MAYTTINKPSEYFNTKLYSGSGSTTTLTGVGFQPDWTWIKRRNSSINHKIYDAVRTAGKSISSNNTSAEITNDAEGYLSAFTSDGFTVQAGTTSDEYVNQSGGTYVSWSWLGGGTGVSNTDGDITSTVSANTTSGFSVVKWTGTGSDGTIGHGLGVAPKMVIVKSLANTTAWMVYHASLGNAQEIYLNDASASGASTAWNSTTPTSTVISLDGGAGNGVNASGDYIAYCFAEKKGFSKFGSYVGNGSTDGTFVYTGFKPAFVLVKNTAITDNWSIFDNKRIGYNAFNYVLYADITNVGSNGLPMDILSNGFKWRTDAGMVNGSGQNHIYMAFAEEPLVGTNGVPATAR
jgi:hypothetical protein